MEKYHETYLKQLYGLHFLNKFHIVQQQQNGYDCGLLAMAFSVSICLERNPENKKYSQGYRRKHAEKIFWNKSLIPFPTDFKCVNGKWNVDFSNIALMYENLTNLT